MSDGKTEGVAAEAALRSYPDSARLRALAGEAQKTICGLWDPGAATFWRSTIHRARAAAAEGAQFFPTATFRSAGALLLLAAECPEWLLHGTETLLREAVIPGLLSQDPNQVRSSLDPTGDQPLNPFTLSLWVQALSILLSQRSIPEGDREVAARQQLAGLLALLEHPVFLATDGQELSPIHPFIQYHAARALRLATRFPSGPGLAQRISAFGRRIRAAARRSIERLLARERLGRFNPGEAIALAFAAATLLDPLSEDDLPYVAESLAVCLRAQDARGSWPFGRVVPAEKDVAVTPLEIPTYEVSAVTVEALLGLLEAHQYGAVPPTVARAVDHVTRAVEYMERSVIRLATDVPPAAGWCSDHAYGLTFIESWTSATVLESLVRCYSLGDALHRRVTLSSFVTVWPEGPEWPTWLVWDSFKAEGEVDHDRPVLQYIDRFIVQPALLQGSGWHRRDPGSISALLFGPPGTAKTTIVHGVAQALGWPLVTLSPGDFIAQGLEMIEAQARSVFQRLMKLSRTVILFDECDELFRFREPRAETEQVRSITAFVTASMLPKLQELHDRGRVVFFICTNNFETMDWAVKRGGRIDHVIAVGPPDSRARKRIVERALAGVTAGLRAAGGSILFPEAVIDEVAMGTERFTRRELERLVRAVVQRAQWTSEEEARTRVREAITSMRDGLIIGAVEYECFLQQQRRFGHVGPAGGGG